MTPELEEAAHELVQSTFAEHAAEAGRVTAAVQADFMRRGMLRSGLYLHELGEKRADALTEHSLRLVEGLLALGLKVEASSEDLETWLSERVDQFVSGQSKALLLLLEEQAKLAGSRRTAETLAALEPTVASIRNRVSQRVRLRLAETKLQRQAVNDPRLLASRAEGRMARDPRKVAVVHGRNLPAKEGLFLFLRALDLRPIEWEDAVRATGKGSPYNREIVQELFTDTQAVLVLLTGDEDASLREPLRENPTDGTPRRQARANVFFEAGMAFLASPDRTILVEIGEQRHPSDLDGLNVVRFDGTDKARQRLRERLETAGCQVKSSGTDWLSVGAAEFKQAAEL